MGFHAEGHHQAQEHSRRLARASIQLRGLHDALHVFISILFAIFFFLFFFEIFLSFFLSFNFYIPALFSLIRVAGPSTTCALKSLLMTIPNNFTTSIRSLLKSTSYQRLVTLSSGAS